MKKILCFFGLHSYKFIRLENYIDTSWGGRSPSTAVFWMCARCRKVKTKDYYGTTFRESDFIIKEGV